MEAIALRRPIANAATEGVNVPPRTQLALRVLVRLHTCRNLLVRYSRRSIESWQLTLPQFDVLAELARAPKRGFTFVELSRLLLVTSGNLTGIVDRLGAEDLVRRDPEPSDRRVIRLTLTPRGRRLTERLLPYHAENVHELLSLMPRDKLEGLSTLLKELQDKLQQREVPAASARVVGAARARQSRRNTSRTKKSG